MSYEEINKLFAKRLVEEFPSLVATSLNGHYEGQDYIGLLITEPSRVGSSDMVALIRVYTTCAIHVTFVEVLEVVDHQFAETLHRFILDLCTEHKFENVTFKAPGHGPI